MKVDKKLIKALVPFAPLVMIFVAIVLLGTVFLRAYDTGNPLPHPAGSGLLIASPTISPSESSKPIADTTTYPAVGASAGSEAQPTIVTQPVLKPAKKPLASATSLLPVLDRPLDATQSLVGTATNVLEQAAEDTTQTVDATLDTVTSGLGINLGPSGSLDNS